MDPSLLPRSPASSRAADRHYIDTHHHVVPPGYAAFLRAKGWTLPVPSWSSDTALSAMDAQGVDVAIISLSTPGLYRAEPDEARRMARQINQFCAEVAATRPDRFGFFATLTLPDADGAAEEAAYALDELGADGVAVLANSRGRYLGEEANTPLFAELDRRHGVVFVHPTFLHECGAPVATGMPRNDADLLVDTTRSAISLVTSGFLDRFPEVRVILSHGGGFLPYMSHRIAAMCAADHSYESGIDSLRRFYFDLSLASSNVALASLVAFAPEHLLFGSDWPFATAETLAHFRAELESFPLDDDQRSAISHRNAEGLFHRFAAPSS